MICLEPMWRVLQRVLDRWYVWNICEDLYTASHWHMIACNTCSDLHRERSWQMICLEPMWRLLQREFLTDDESGTYVEIFAQRVPDWHMFAFFWWKLVVNTKCHFLRVSVVSVTIPQTCICRSVWETQWKNRTFPKVAKPSTFHRHPRRNYTRMTTDRIQRKTKQQ